MFYIILLLLKKKKYTSDVKIRVVHEVYSIWVIWVVDNATLNCLFILQIIIVPNNINTIFDKKNS